MEQIVQGSSTLPVPAMERLVVRGKFLFVGDKKFWVRGVSYGTFQVENGSEQLVPETVERDFSAMVENGFNVVRVHLCPPRWLLDVAQKTGLRVMVGLNWGEHMSFIDEPRRSKEIERQIRGWVRSCAGHPAVFCYSVGNEISASMVRWTGRHKVEKFVKRLYQVAKEEDPDALVTYVNYPTTEYLRLPFLDFLCFNVYLESQQAFESYIARLHNLSLERPVLISEIGLDSLRNGEERQAEMLGWQIQTIFEQGCCGVIVFAWTDEWYHGKYLVEDWKFGLTTRDRSPKPALRAVRRAFLESPFPSDISWPGVSVVVCTHNGASTIRDTLDGLQTVDYPDFEVIVVNDGSTDSTVKIASRYPFRLINTENRGLSQARNNGINAATKEIIAFIDDDAYPDEDWLRFLALSLTDRKLVGTGGPNLSPADDGWKAEAIANAPGPNPVLLSDKIAEHIPGCNMAFRREALEAIGGFDPRFRIAGDDVDICWRLQEHGGVIGYAPAALVWHHRRRSIRKYWKQQLGYGRAEALLEHKWPEKYNTFGQVRWTGRIYGKGTAVDLSSISGRVYQGVWGTAPFQYLYGSSNTLWSITLMPEWYLIIGMFAALFTLTLGWGPAVLAGTGLTLAIALPAAQAAINATRAKLSNFYKGKEVFRSRITIFTLHLLQPLARLVGRIGGGLTPWRRRAPRIRPKFLSSQMKMWRDRWEPPETTLRDLYTQLRSSGAVTSPGSDYDSWDLEIRGGLFGRSRLLLGVEDHPPGKQLLRYRIAPTYSLLLPLVLTPFAILSLVAGFSGAWLSSITSGTITFFIAINALIDSAFANGRFREFLKRAGAT